MKFCSKCGKETVDEDAVICLSCGCALNSAANPALDNPSALWTLLAVWQPIIGIILYCIWKDEKPLTAKCILKGVIASIIISVVMILVFVVIWCALIFMATAGTLV